MRTVYKYPIEAFYLELMLPEEANIVYVGLDSHSVPCIWVELNPNDAQTKQKIMVFGTGYSIDDPNLEHIGSFVQDVFVWHVYIHRNPYNPLI